MSSVFQIESKNSRYRLFILLCIKAAFLIFLVSSTYLSLAPDEAQYWTWSRNLDWGYYSKPPGIAWQIWITTSILGNHPLGVRMGAILIGFFLPIAIYFIARFSDLDERISFWAAIAMAFSPLGIYLSIAATTDGGMILFLLLAILIVIKGFHEGEGPNYLLTGVLIFLGALFKWTAFIFWPFLWIFLFFYPTLRKKSLILGMIISLLALIPSLYWNFDHDWATFKHVFNTIYQPTEEIKKTGNFFDFLGAQIGLISPIFMLLLIWSYFYFNRLKSFPLIFCATFPLAVLIFLLMAFFKKMQPNWAAYLYPPGMVLIAWVAIKYIRGGRIWLHFGTWLSIIGILFALTIPGIQSKALFSKFQIPYRVNPFRQNMGWSHLEDILEQVGYKPDQNFLFADKYQAASILSFYGPKQYMAYYFNLNQQRKNQFSYWPSIAREKGNDGFFVVFENTNEKALSWYEKHYQERLSPYFKQVEYVGGFPIFKAYGKGVKYAIVFKGIDYSGVAPEDPEAY